VAALEKETAVKDGKNVYARLNEMLASTPPGAKGLVLLPYLASATTPRWNPHARGTLLGLTFAYDRASLEVRDMVNSMAAAGIGAFSSIAEGAERMVQIDRKYVPNPRNAKLYDEIFGIYCLAYEALEEKGVFQALARLQAGY
jgi:xylulokinase